MKAVVVDAVNEYSVQSVELDPPKQGEVLVRMKATGVCHSDLSIINGTIPWTYPTVIGHEGSGIVEGIGEGVTNVSVGDHVAMSFVPNCGECYYCQNQEPYLCTVTKPDGMLLDGTTRVHRNGGERVSVMTYLGNMAEYAVVPSVCLVAIDKSFDFKAAALVGCGVTTGVGAVFKTAGVEPGSTVAVFGCGGVGLNVIQGARIAGAARIIAVDLSAEKMEKAKEFGATDTVTPGGNAAKEIFALTNGIGADYAFEVVGNSKLVETCVKCIRKNGTAVLVGMGSADDKYSINCMIMPYMAKTIKGCMYGSCNFKVDFPRYLNLYQQGKLDLDRLITRTYTIDEAKQAFIDLENGTNARGVIVFE